MVFSVATRSGGGSQEIVMLLTCPFILTTLASLLLGYGNVKVLGSAARVGREVGVGSEEKRFVEAEEEWRLINIWPQRIGECSQGDDARHRHKSCRYCR